MKRTIIAIAAGILIVWHGLAVSAQPRMNPKGTPLDPTPENLIGTWEVLQTKAPGETYTSGYRNQPFVTTGPNAFTLIMEYRRDGTFRRISRVGTKENIQEGKWSLSGHELRHARQGAEAEEIMYIRFDAPDEYTTVDVYEGSPDPGLFGRFKRVQ